MNQPNQTATAPTTAAHLHSFEGSLWDSRTNTIVRPVYERHFAAISNSSQLKATLRSGSVTWPGCYPLYFITSDGAALSFETVRREFRSVLSSVKTACSDGWRVVACEVNYDESELRDDHTGELIGAAYV
jgi:hypothetical protein